MICSFTNLTQQFLPGWTPLHVAAEGGRDAVVEVLLRHRADPSLVTDTGLEKAHCCVHTIAGWSLMSTKHFLEATLVIIYRLHCSPPGGIWRTHKDLPHADTSWSASWSGAEHLCVFVFVFLYLRQAGQVLIVCEFVYLSTTHHCDCQVTEAGLRGAPIHYAAGKGSSLFCVCFLSFLVFCLYLFFDVFVFVFCLWVSVFVSETRRSTVQQQLKHSSHWVSNKSNMGRATAVIQILKPIWNQAPATPLATLSVICWVPWWYKYLL